MKMMKDVCAECTLVTTLVQKPVSPASTSTVSSCPRFACLVIPGTRKGRQADSCPFPFYCFFFFFSKPGSQTSSSSTKLNSANPIVSQVRKVELSQAAATSGNVRTVEQMCWVCSRDKCQTGAQEEGADSVNLFCRLGHLLLEPKKKTRRQLYTLHH